MAVFSFRFRKQERLRYKRAFSFLFSHQKSFRSGFLKFVYTFELPNELAEDVLGVAFAVPKRNFKRAVDRNLLKRRMREAYRLNRMPLKRALQEHEQCLALLIVYQDHKKHPYRNIETHLKAGLRRLSEERTYS